MTTSHASIVAYHASLGTSHAYIVAYHTSIETYHASLVTYIASMGNSHTYIGAYHFTIWTSHSSVVTYIASMGNYHVSKVVIMPLYGTLVPLYFGELCIYSDLLSKVTKTQLTWLEFLFFGIYTMPQTFPWGATRQSVI